MMPRVLTCKVNQRLPQRLDLDVCGVNCGGASKINTWSKTYLKQGVGGQPTHTPAFCIVAMAFPQTPKEFYRPQGSLRGLRSNQIFLLDITLHM